MKIYQDKTEKQRIDRANEASTGRGMMPRVKSETTSAASNKATSLARRKTKPRAPDTEKPIAGNFTHERNTRKSNERTGAIACKEARGANYVERSSEHSKKQQGQG